MGDRQGSGPSDDDAAAASGGRKRIGILGWGLRIAALGYPCALLAIILALRFIGERWWVTAVGLYVPRRPFALPLPFLVLALAWVGPRRWLITQAVAALLLVFPLMGLNVSWPASPRPGATRLRIATLNIDAGAFGAPAIAAQLGATNADIIFLQEAYHGEGDVFRRLLPGYTIQADGQFVLATRYPIVEVTEPPKIPHGGHLRSPRFMRYRVALPDGRLIRVYNVHPLSPREAFEDLRGEGIRAQIATGRIFTNAKARDTLVSNCALRMEQVQAVSEDARTSPDPVIIAGDTNLPGLSWGRSRWLGGFSDGFSDAGHGFGYTFPSLKRTWMRIDRVMTDARFRFLDVTVVTTPHVSDHLAVVADLEMPAPAAEKSGGR